MAKGGKREGAGRKKGSPNKATADIKKLAQEHGPEAIETLAALMRNGGEQVKKAAASELLDRGYGKPAQVHIGDDEAPPITFIERRIVRPSD